MASATSPSSHGAHPSSPSSSSSLSSSSSAPLSFSSSSEVDENGLPIVPPWLRHYNRVISRKPQLPPAVGPTACSVCCTFFSLFGAVFLFSISAMMRANYRYIHIDPALAGPGITLPALSTSVSYAALLYLIMGVVSLCYW